MKNKKIMESPLPHLKWCAGFQGLELSWQRKLSQEIKWPQGSVVWML